MSKNIQDMLKKDYSVRKELLEKLHQKMVEIDLPIIQDDLPSYITSDYFNHILDRTKDQMNCQYLAAEMEGDWLISITLMLINHDTKILNSFLSVFDRYEDLIVSSPAIIKDNFPIKQNETISKLSDGLHTFYQLGFVQQFETLSERDKEYCDACHNTFEAYYDRLLAFAIEGGKNRKSLTSQKPFNPNYHSMHLYMSWVLSMKDDFIEKEPKSFQKIINSFIYNYLDSFSETDNPAGIHLNVRNLARLYSNHTEPYIVPDYLQIKKKSYMDKFRSHKTIGFLESDSISALGTDQEPVEAQIDNVNMNIFYHFLRTVEIDSGIYLDAKNYSLTKSEYETLVDRVLFFSDLYFQGEDPVDKIIDTLYLISLKLVSISKYVQELRKAAEDAYKKTDRAKNKKNSEYIKQIEQYKEKHQNLEKNLTQQKAQYETLEKQYSKLKKEYKKGLEQEIKKKDQQIEKQNLYIKELEERLKQYESNPMEEIEASAAVSNPVSNQPVLVRGTENDLWDNEVQEIVLDSLKEYSKTVPEFSRRKIILDDLIEANPVSDAVQKRRNSIRQILRGKSRVNSSMASQLKKCGLTLEDSKTHYKIVYFGDKRFVATMAKTGSDNRNGDNLATEIGQKFL